MQYAKDSFYLAIRDRLAALDPERQVVVDGVERPAVLVAENEPLKAAAPLPNAFYLAWGAPEIVAGSENAPHPLMKMDCRVSYHIGARMQGSVDRGRALSALDTELLCLLIPPRTPKIDPAVSPAAALGSQVFWGGVEFENGDKTFDRVASLPVFFFPEGEQA